MFSSTTSTSSTSTTVTLIAANLQSSLFRVSNRPSTFGGQPGGGGPSALPHLSVPPPDATRASRAQQRGGGKPRDDDERARQQRMERGFRVEARLQDELRLAATLFELARSGVEYVGARAGRLALPPRV